MPDLQTSLCDLGIITSANIAQLAASEHDDCDDGDCDSDCIGCVG